MQMLILSILLWSGFLFAPLWASADPPDDMSSGMGMMGHGAGGGGMMGSGAGGCGMEGIDGCGMMGDGMMGSHGGFGFGQFGQLDLTPDQKANLNKIRLSLQKQEWTLKGKTFDMRASLNELYSVDRPDPKKIGAVYAQLFDIKRQMIEAHIDALNRARDILNKDQQAKLKQLQQHGAGSCPMHEQMHHQEKMEH